MDPKTLHSVIWRGFFYHVLLFLAIFDIVSARAGSKAVAVSCLCVGVPICFSLRATPALIAAVIDMACRERKRILINDLTNQDGEFVLCLLF